MTYSYTTLWDVTTFLPSLSYQLDYFLGVRSTALTRAIEKAPEKAKTALNAALNRANSKMKQSFRKAGAKGPYIRVQGFITALNVEEGSGTVTIDDIDDGEVTLIITEATEIDVPVSVGDFVKAKYDVDQEAAEIELEDDEMAFRGRITGFSDSSLELDKLTFVIDAETEISCTLPVGAAPKVQAIPLNGTFIALLIKTTQERKNKEREGKEPEGFEIIGKVTALSATELEVGGLTVVITPETKIDGTLELEAKVEVEATIKDGTVLAKKIEVKGKQRPKKERSKSDFEFRGIIDSLSDTAIEVDGLTVLLTPDTKIDGTLSTGSLVEVEAIMSDGTLVALKVEVKEAKGKRSQKDARGDKDESNGANNDRGKKNSADGDKGKSNNADKDRRQNKKENSPKLTHTDDDDDDHDDDEDDDDHDEDEDGDDD